MNNQKSLNMNSIDTQEIADVVNRMHLPAGLGTRENACSIAAKTALMFYPDLRTSRI
jgi:hypothetical protein